MYILGMGIFDPPATSIRKKLPQDAQAGFAELAAKVECLVPPSLSKTQASLVVAVAMGAWVASENRADRFPLSDYNGRYIQNMVYNCYARLSGLSEVATGIVDQLTIAGLITPLPD